MTRDEILKLEGQELVKAVGKRLWPTEFTKGKKANYLHCEEWNPLTDENALAEVREKMIDRNYNFRGDELTTGVCMVEFHNRGKQVCKYAEGPSYALTLLRAALLAVNQEGEK